MKLIKKQLVTAILASTFSAFAANAAPINFDGAKNVNGDSKIVGCSLREDTTDPVTRTIYDCNTGGVPSTFQNDVNIASNITVNMGQNPLKAASAILGVGAILNGDLDSNSTVVLGAKAEVKGNDLIYVDEDHIHNEMESSSIDAARYSIHAMSTVALGSEAKVTGNVYAQTTIAVGADGTVIGDVKATTTIAVGANGEVTGDVYAGTTFALGAGAEVGEDVNAGTTVALGANSHVDGNVEAGTTVALGADSYVEGNVKSATSTVTLGVKAYVKGTTETLLAAVTLGAGAYTCDNVEAVTATLGAGSVVDGDLEATTSTVAAGAIVTGEMRGTDGLGNTHDTAGNGKSSDEDLRGTTITLGADSCYGFINRTGGNPTVTVGAGAEACTADQKVVAKCT